MSMLQKLKKLGISAMVLAAGFAYYLAARFFFAVPCVFRTLTGFKCPGCGITHMLIAELQLDFASTFGDDVTKVFTDAVNLVHEKYGDKADYLQTFVCELGKAKEEKVRFWLILDEYGKNNLKVTALLPEEY